VDNGHWTFSELIAALAVLFLIRYNVLELIGMSISKQNGVIKMSPAQCRMARAALQIGVRDLAEMAKMSPSTVARFEAGEELKERTVDAMRAALEKAGVEFIEGNGGGVKLRKAHK
jgi:hypothetical protein